MKNTRISQWIRTWWRPGVGLLGLALIMAWSGQVCSRKVEPGKLASVQGLDLPVGIRTAEAVRRNVGPRIDVVGTVTSESLVHLSARIPAYIKEVLVTAGDTVNAAQLLVILDDREIQEQASAAEAQLNQATKEYERTRALFEKQAATEQALTAADSAFRSARAEAERVKVMLTYAQIRSPIDGVVTDRRIEPGDLANPGQLLLALYDPRKMRLEAPVPVRLIERLPLGAEVEVELDRPARTYTGKVTEVVSEIDPLTRTQKVKVRIEAAGEHILPGTFGRLWVIEEPRPSVLVPATSVHRVGQLEMCQVVESNRVYRRLVKTGPHVGDEVEILSGLNGGEVIVHPPLPED